MKLATWNVNSLAIRLPQLLTWLATHQPDVMCLQETKLEDEKFPHAEIAAAGYRCEFFGQKTYNGVALLSRAPATDVVRNIPGFDDPQARVIAATVDGRARRSAPTFPNGQMPGSDKFAYKMRWLGALCDWIARRVRAPPGARADGRLQHRAARTRMSTTRSPGTARSCARRRSAAISRRSAAPACTMRSASSSSRRRAGRWWDYRQLAFQKGRGCASTTSWSARR